MNHLSARLVHLDLADGLPAGALVDEESAAYVVFWWRGVPLGHQLVRRGSAPLPSSYWWNLAVRTITPAVGAQLFDRGFEAPLPGMNKRWSPVDGPDPQALVELAKPLQTLEGTSRLQSDASVSVVICTRDRPENLERCLRSLLDCSPKAAEIVVVDNASSSDATRRLTDRFSDALYVAEPTPGLNVARNAGIRRSRGEIVAFVDDDVLVHPQWVARVAEGFSDSRVMAVAGLVLPAELETEAQCLFEEHWGFNRGYRVVTYDARFFDKLKARGVPAWEIGAGANMAFRREVFERVGDFDPRLDVGAAGCSGDSEMWYRLLAAGMTCQYDPKAVAYHYHRREMSSLRKQLYYYLRGHSTALLIQASRHRHWGNLVRLFILHPVYYAKLLARGLVSGWRPRHRFIPVECAGLVSGLFFYLRNMRSRETS
jgi:glycosyltransferase involved in cell wall biosynthesis